MARPTNPSGQTAGTLILVGLILQGIEVLVLLGFGLLFLLVPFVGAIVLGFALFGIIWLVLVYVFSYQRTREGDYQGARTPTIVFAILSLLSFALISGILYLIAYIKLGDAETAQLTPAAPVFAPMPPSPAASGGGGGTPLAGGKFCTYCGRQNAPTSKFCAGCGAALG